MKTQIIITLVSILINLNLIGQVQSLEWKEIHKESGDVLFLGVFDNGCHVIDKKVKNKSLYVLDSQGSIILTKEADLSYEGKSLKPREVIETKSGKYLYMANLESKTSKFHVYVSKLEEEGMGKVNKLYSHSMQADMAYQYSSYFNQTGISPGSFIYNIDSSLIAYVHEYTNEYHWGRSIGIVVFDENMDQVWKKRFVIKELKERSNPFSFKLMSSGNVYCLAQNYGDGSNPIALKSIKFTPEEYSLIDVSLPGFHLEDGSIFVPENEENIFGVGFYSSSEEFNSYEGLYVAQFDFGELTQKIRPLKFEESLYEDFTPIKKIKDFPGISPDFQINEAISYNDELFGFNAERHSTSESTSGSSSNVMNRELILPIFDKTSEMVDIMVIPKKETLGLNDFDGYSMIPFSDGFYQYLYNYRSPSKEVLLKIVDFSLEAQTFSEYDLIEKGKSIYSYPRGEIRYANGKYFILQQSDRGFQLGIIE
ncbi:MAG: hypothetical protein ACI9O4_001739 [Chitinophagales bacterium]|jgi:hypothetical protein